MQQFGSSANPSLRAGRMNFPSWDTKKRIIDLNPFMLLVEATIHTLLMWLALASSQPFLVFSITLPHSFIVLKFFINTQKLRRASQFFIQNPKKFFPAPQDIKGTPLPFLAAPQFSCEPSGTSENDVSNNQTRNKMEAEVANTQG